MLKAAVLGASGYAGGELVRLLLGHPSVRLAFAAAPSGAGQPLAAVHPALRGLTDVPLAPLPASATAWPAGLDVIFLCLPHGVSAGFADRLPHGVRVVDLGGDFRLRDDEVHATWYPGTPRPAGWQERVVYGLPELFRPAVTTARYVANPGCFATACILATAPLARFALAEPRVILDAKTGSSGAGTKPTAATHHPERASSFFAYKPFQHQHLPEIQQALAAVAPAWPGELLLQAHATPLVRGIFVTAYARLRDSVSPSAVSDAFHQLYEGCPFVRLGQGSPNVAWSKGGNFVDLGWETCGRDLVVFAGLDNLIKGAAGQALQNMNLLLGLPETAGLWHAGGVL